MTKYYLEVETYNKELPYFTIFEFITKTKDIQVGYTLHESIPQAEPEWSPDIRYPLWTALHYAEKYGLELSWGGLLTWYTPHDFITQHSLEVRSKDKDYKLRKQQSIDDKLRDVLNSIYTHNDDRIQAIKDVFKEEK